MAWCPQFLSVRMWMTCPHLPPRARTRWVTERIASKDNGPESKHEIIGSNSALRNGSRAVVINPKKKNWERKLFYLLTPALMGDPELTPNPNRTRPGDFYSSILLL